MYKPNDFWRKMLRSEETKIEFFDHYDTRHVWKSKHEAFKPKNTVLALTHGGGHIILWDSFAASGIDTNHNPIKNVWTVLKNQVHARKPASINFLVKKSAQISS